MNGYDNITLKKIERVEDMPIALMELLWHLYDLETEQLIKSPNCVDERSINHRRQNEL